jgi:mRNA interferase HicA
MKRRDLIRHLENNGCEFLREGGNHTIYVNRRSQKSKAAEFAKAGEVYQKV